MMDAKELTEALEALRQRGVEMLYRGYLFSNQMLSPSEAVCLLQQPDALSFDAAMTGIDIEHLRRFSNWCYEARCSGTNRKGKPCGNQVRAYWGGMHYSPEQVRRFRFGIDDRCEYHVDQGDA